VIIVHHRAVLRSGAPMRRLLDSVDQRAVLGSRAPVRRLSTTASRVRRLSTTASRVRRLPTTASRGSPLPAVIGRCEPGARFGALAGRLIGIDSGARLRSSSRIVGPWIRFRAPGSALGRLLLAIASSLRCCFHGTCCNFGPAETD
jgi:hypothetical protein